MGSRILPTASEGSSCFLSPIANVPAELRELADQLGREITALRAITTALKLAAELDQENRVRLLFWPDLMDILESQLPDEDALESGVVSVIHKVEAVLRLAHEHVRALEDLELPSPAALTAEEPTD